MIGPGLRAVVFDFDYTLADSSRGVVECVCFAFDRLGLPTVPAAAIFRTIGLSLTDTFLELAGPQHAALADEFIRLFTERADEVMAERTVILGAVPAVIRQLGVWGLVLGIVSTKFRRRIERVLEREGLLDSFATIVGGEDVEDHKPVPDGLNMALERLGSPPASALYVGDSVIDAETAKQAGVPFVAVLTGVTQLASFAAYAPCAVVGSLAELPELVRPAGGGR